MLIGVSTVQLLLLGMGVVLLVIGVALSRRTGLAERIPRVGLFVLTAGMAFALAVGCVQFACVHSR